MSNRLRTYLSSFAVALWLALLLALMSAQMPGLGSAALAQSSKPYTIGFYAPLSGPVALLGMPAKEAVQMAAKKANAAGGVHGRKIKVIYADTKADYSVARQIVGRFVRSDRVDAVIGSLTSPGTLATMGETARVGIPHVTFAANASQVTNSGHKNIFRTSITSERMYSGLAQFAVQKLKLKRMAIMGFNEEFGQANTKAFRKKISEMGTAQIVGVEWYQLDERNFSSLLRKLMQAKPDGIVLTGAVADCALIVKQARAIGYGGVFLGNGPQSLIPFRKIAGAAAEGTYLATPYAPSFYTHAEAQTFAREWAASHKGQRPAWTAAHAYDAFNVLVNAVRKVGAEDRPKILEAIRATKNFPGVAGMTSFMSNGEVIKPVFIQRWKGMSIEPVASLEVEVK